MDVPFEPYYDQDGITIYNADCRKVLESIDAGAFVTDPPYGIDWNTDYARFTNSMQSKPRTSQPKIANDKTDEMMRLALEYPVKERIVWGAHLSPWLVGSRGTWIVWDKRFDNGKAMLADGELAWHSEGATVCIHKHTWQGMIGNNSGRPMKRLHPNQKPVSLLSFCISRLKSGGLIVDPFMGSGTTLVAAKLAGRKAVGIEINEKYCEAAANRLAQGVLF